MSATNSHPLGNPDLGDIIEEFRPAKSNIVAGMILSLMMVVGGGMLIVIAVRGVTEANWKLPFNSDFGWNWLAVCGVAAIGVVIIACGAFLARYAKGLVSGGISVCENGFRYYARGTVEDVPWTEVSRLRETVSYERLPIRGPARVLAPGRTYSSYTIITHAGKEYAFDVNTVRALERLGKLLRAEMFRRSLPYETVQGPK